METIIAAGGGKPKSSDGGEGGKLKPITQADADRFASEAKQQLTKQGRKVDAASIKELAKKIAKAAGFKVD